MTLPATPESPALARQTRVIYLPDPQASDHFAAWLAPRLRAGDVLLLSGQIGAGKSHLARALIRNRLGRMEEVPSPTFTLVQCYDDGNTEIWHADLYRLTHPDEVMELGLIDAFETGICLVEWPDRLGPHAPADALRLSLSPQGEGRMLTVTVTGRPALLADLDRDWPEGAGHG